MQPCSNCETARGETRLLRLSPQFSMALCRRCFEKEMRWRMHQPDDWIIWRWEQLRPTDKKVDDDV